VYLPTGPVSGSRWCVLLQCSKVGPRWRPRWGHLSRSTHAHAHTKGVNELDRFHLSLIGARHRLGVMQPSKIFNTNLHFFKKKNLPLFRTFLRFPRLWLTLLSNTENLTPLNPPSVSIPHKNCNYESLVSVVLPSNSRKLMFFWPCIMN